jgi:hypothetical protein
VQRRSRKMGDDDQNRTQNQSERENLSASHNECSRVDNPKRFEAV